MSAKENGSDSSSSGNVLASFINGGIDSFYNYIDSWTGDYFNKRSEKRAFQRALALMEYQYAYAQRYAENTPSWHVTGLRNAGLNPILAVTNGANLSAPNVNVPSVNPTSVGRGHRSGNYYDPLLSRQMALLDSQIEGQKIKNKNDAMNRGLTGKYGAYSRVLSEVIDSVPSSKPSGYDKVMDLISNSIRDFSNYTRNSPSDNRPNRLEGKPSDDTPPEMSKWTKHVDHDGFDSRLWSRSGRKYDGQYRYKKREPWTSVFTH